MKKTVIFGIALFLTGCAATPTPYQQLKTFETGSAGGYTNVKLQDTIYRVTFEGNDHTTQGTTGDFALLRSAQVTIDNGYSYFVILDNQDYVKVGDYTPPGDVAKFRKMYQQECYAYNKPETVLTIQCFEGKPGRLPTIIYDAYQVRTNLQEKHAIK